MAQSKVVLIVCMAVAVGFVLSGPTGKSSNSASNSNETSSEEMNSTTNGSVKHGKQAGKRGIHKLLSRNITSAASNTTNGTKAYESVMPTACLDGWIAYNQSCFYVGQTAKTWATAQMDCNAHGASLWVVNSITEWDSISRYAAKSSFNWIGLSWPVENSNVIWAAQTTSTSQPTLSGIYTELLPWLVPTGSHGYTPNLACVALYAYPDLGSNYITFRACSTASNYVCKGPNANGTDHTMTPNPNKIDTIIAG